MQQDFCQSCFIKKCIFFLPDVEKFVVLPPKVQAGIAQLVERNLAKVNVASSSLVSRSTAQAVNLLQMLHDLSAFPRGLGMFFVEIRSFRKKCLVTNIYPCIFA